MHALRCCSPWPYWSIATSAFSRKNQSSAARLSPLFSKCHADFPIKMSFKPGFHIVVSVVSVVSVVRKKFIGQIQLFGNLPYKCSIQKKRQIQLVLRDRVNSIHPMIFFRKTDTTDMTDTTIWKPGLRLIRRRRKVSSALFFFVYDN